MTAAPEVVCCTRPGCGHRYTGHAPGGAHCQRCGCHGFQWVDPEGTSGSYGTPPAR